MRTALTLVALLLCLALWLWGLLLGRPWPVTIAFMAPRMADNARGPLRAPDTHAPQSEGIQAPRSPTTALLQPRAGTPQLTAPLACAPAQLTVQVQDAFGTTAGLAGVAVGWPGREDGYGVLAPTQGRTTLSTAGRGLAPPPLLTLTSLGGHFDGTGTLEVMLPCD